MRGYLKWTFVLLVLAICFETSGQSESTDNNCTILHEGTFKYGGTENEIKVIIKGKKHTEYHNDGKYLIESKLDWLNECEYNMTMTKITIPNFPYKKGDVMNVKVNEVNGNEISYISTVKGVTWDGTLIKIK